MNEDGTHQILQTERNKRLAAVVAIQPDFQDIDSLSLSLSLHLMPAAKRKLSNQTISTTKLIQSKRNE